MRPVDADTLIPLIQEDKIEGETLNIIKALGESLQAETLNQACDRHIKIINSLPTLEPKKGAWIPGREIAREMIGDVITGIFYEDWKCSDCGYTVEDRKPLWKYCPNCGAKMENGKE